MSSSFGKVHRAHLGEFLRHRAEYWDLDGPLELFSTTPPNPASVAELLDVLAPEWPQVDYTFVVAGPLDPEDDNNPETAEILTTVDELVAFIGPNAETIRIAPSPDWIRHGQSVVVRPSEEGDGFEDYGTDADVMGDYDVVPRPFVTRLVIENFKGIGESVEIELKPITLLFGPNSAGKSTVLHALHYAREVFERRNLDADQTAAGGKFIDLGGFRNFVHGRDVGRAVRFQFDLDLENHDLPAYYTPGGAMTAGEYETLTNKGEVRSARVSFSIAWSELRASCYVRDYAVVLNGTPLARIECQSDGRSVFLTDINYRHPVLPRAEALELIADLAATEGMPSTGPRPIRYSVWAIEQQPDALPEWGRALPLAMLVEPGTVEVASAEMAQATMNFMDSLIALFGQLIVGPGQLLRDWLQAFRYLGPIRETPSRGYTPPKSPDPSRWSSGMAAWDLLTNGHDHLVMRISDWLSRPDRLNTRYSVERRRYKRLDLADPLTLALASGRAFDETDAARINLNRLPTEAQVVLVSEDTKLDLLPSDVGIGISQVLPVVVAAAWDDDRLVLIEQPELHVHPRIQAEIGDLFIETAMSGPHNYLIETHSEHLILRILRRIRETNEEKPHNAVSITGADVAVFYVSMEGDRTRLRKIDIDKKGDFVQPWPDDFFEIDFYERFGRAD